MERELARLDIFGYYGFSCQPIILWEMFAISDLSSFVTRSRRFSIHRSFHTRRDPVEVGIPLNTFFFFFLSSPHNLPRVCVRTRAATWWWSTGSMCRLTFHSPGWVAGVCLALICGSSQKRKKKSAISPFSLLLAVPIQNKQYGFTSSLFLGWIWHYFVFSTRLSRFGGE